MPNDANTFKNWRWSCPVCLFEFKNRLDVCTNCNFKEGLDDHKITELRHAYLGCKMEKEKTEKFKENLAVIFAVAGLLIVLAIVLMKI
jgi:hypothetical protein